MDVDAMTTQHEREIVRAPEPAPDAGSAANPLLKLVIQFGVPAGIAVYLVWIISGNLMGATAQAQRATEQTLIALQTHITQAAVLQIKIEDEQTALDILVQIDKVKCLHESRNVQERSECYDASKR